MIEQPLTNVIENGDKDPGLDTWSLSLLSESVYAKPEAVTGGVYRPERAVITGLSLYLLEKPPAGDNPVCGAVAVAVAVRTVSCPTAALRGEDCCSRAVEAFYPDSGGENHVGC
jgi:hypothetical protein